MKPIVIENPIINSPFAEPNRHFRFGDEGITNEIDAGRRRSVYFVPIAPPKSKGKQKQLFDAVETNSRGEQRWIVWKVGVRGDRGPVGCHKIA